LHFAARSRIINYNLRSNNQSPSSYEGIKIRNLEIVCKFSLVILGVNC